MNQRQSTINNHQSTNDLAVIVLAAGQGKRIGMPKWKLEIDDKNFISIICDKLKKVGLKNIYCTYRKTSLPDYPGIEYIENETPEYGMISSIYYGIKETAKYSGYLIWPVDHPFTTTETLSILCDEFLNQRQMVRPVYNNRGGHPIIIPGVLAVNIPVDYDGGIKKFFIDNNVNIQDIEVNDPDIKSNINYKENLTKYL
ncbi:MAG: NTP transferase domain-containing protein [bacterium]|nr:NTP transferase domain-containing protein [bacterium]